MLSWSSFVRRFFHDFLVHRLFKYKRSFLNIASDRLLFEKFPGSELERRSGYSRLRNERVAVYDRVTQSQRYVATNVIQISPSEEALATKMHAYVRILLNAISDPDSFDSTMCPNAAQRRVYIETSLEAYAELLYDVYCEQELTPGALAGDPPEFDININALMSVLQNLDF